MKYLKAFEEIDAHSLWNSAFGKFKLKNPEIGQWVKSKRGNKFGEIVDIEEEGGLVRVSCDWSDEYTQTNQWKLIGSKDPKFVENEPKYFCIKKSGSPFLFCLSKLDAEMILKKLKGSEYTIEEITDSKKSLKYLNHWSFPPIQKY